MFTTLCIFFKSKFFFGKPLGSSSKVTDEVGREICRLFLHDRKSNFKFLIDTGADVSVYPATSSERLQHPASLELYAANHSAIKTYGERTLFLDFGLKRKFRWSFILADVTKPIIGADFLKHNGLLVDIKNNCLIDNASKSRCSGTLYLEPIPYTIKSVSENSEFYQILKEYEDLMKPHTHQTPVKHFVKHHIQTWPSSVFLVTPVISRKTSSCQKRIRRYG